MSFFRNGCSLAMMLLIADSYAGSLFKRGDSDDSLRDESALDQSDTSNDSDSDSSNGDNNTDSVDVADSDKKSSKASSSNNANKKNKSQQKPLSLNEIINELQSKGPADPVVLKINNEEVARRSKIIKAIKKAPKQALVGSPQEIFANFRNQVKLRYLMVEQARRARMDKDTEFIDALEEAKDNLLVNAFLMKALTPKMSDESAIKEKYQKYKDNFKSEVEHKMLSMIFIDGNLFDQSNADSDNSSGEDSAASRAQAALKELKKLEEEILKDLPANPTQKQKEEANNKKIAAFRKVAHKYGSLPLPSNDTAIYISESEMPANLKSAIKNLKKSDRTDVIQIDKSSFIILLLDSRNSTPKKLEDMASALRNSVVFEEIDKIHKDLIKKATIVEFEADGSEVKSEENSIKTQQAADDSRSSSSTTKAN